MKRRILILSAVVVLLAITVVPALAITNGQPDGGAHPYVGLAVFDNAAGPGFEQLELGQRLERLTQRRAADTQAGHEFPLGRKLVSGRKGAVQDQGCQLA